MVSITLPIIAVTAKEREYNLDPTYIDDLVTGYRWIDYIGEPWLKGSGTEEDPYMIKNVVINGSGFTFCMAIWNSKAFFKIMNCIFYNTKPPSPLDRNAGLSLSNTSNGIIFKNKFFDNGWMGTEMGSGIALVEYSENNKIQKNLCVDNAAVGIYVENSDNNVIIDNYCSGSIWGIMLWNIGFGSSDVNEITRNDCIGNSVTGIVVAGGAFGNIVSKNLCKGSLYGISVGNWAWDNEVIQNDCTGNSVCGILLNDNGMYNEIKGNTCTENQNGILLLNFARYNIVEDNLCKNNEWGISIGSAHYNVITGNDIIENWITGIQLWDYFYMGQYMGYSLWNMIFHNNIIDNVMQAGDIAGWNIWYENYWSDYTGTDIDGDGIGDTDLPWPYPGYGFDPAPFMEKNGWETEI
jgi:parallel beta-helix repeat protein